MSLLPLLPMESFAYRSIFHEVSVIEMVSMCNIFFSLYTQYSIYVYWLGCLWN